jgi:hypothetical protein
MDTNLVLPLTGRSVDHCRVVFDYWLQPDALAAAAASAVEVGSGQQQQKQQQKEEYRVLNKDPQVAAAMRSAFVLDSLSASHQVQVRRQLGAVPLLPAGAVAFMLAPAGFQRLLHSQLWLGLELCGPVLDAGDTETLVPAARAIHPERGLTCF